MPKRNDIHKILLVGSGPIVIGQACEFDYSGTQALKALRNEGYDVVLVNSNPATIMTDPEFSNRTYIEPLTIASLTKIIERERPDAFLPTIGGQTSLNAAVGLHEAGILAKYNVELIGAKIDAIRRAEERDYFKRSMLEIGLDIPKGKIIHTEDEAMALLDEIPFPIIIRPSYTLGGIGSNIAYNREEYQDFIKEGLSASPINEVLAEESVIGWKEFELEVMRDLYDNVVIICSIENFDPMGVHTGDSITVAPAQTLTDREYQVMRDASIKIIRKIGVETGGSNIQFAVNPANGRMVVIEMNPRVSRSSALASKATGYPIAKIAALLSVGYRLDEITNDITGTTPASFEPVLDYVVVKIPRWDFEKFPRANQQLNTAMKSIGEVMAIGKTFKEALQKGIRSLEQGRFGLGADGKELESIIELHSMSTREQLERVRNRIRNPYPDRLFYLRHAFHLGMTTEELHKLTFIDPWFLENISEIVEMEKTLLLSSEEMTLPPENLIRKAKQMGFSDRQLSTIYHKPEKEIRDHRIGQGITASFKMVDTCAAEFESRTPYFYSTFESVNEVRRTDRKKIMILGGGPNRIGQGIEFDYCCVHGVMALKEMGFETIMVNSNPETVSTDYDTSDKLYFEPLVLENVLDIYDNEKPDGVVVQFGGQTPLKLALPLERAGVPIIGTSPDSIDMAEDRRRFGEVLRKLKIAYPQYGTGSTEEEAARIAGEIGYPVLVRPSYVLGGRAMEIVYNERDIRHYMRHAVKASPEHPILIDKFLEDAFEFDVDAISDGEETVIGGIMQHIEEAGIHSGDSACVLPPYMATPELLDQMRRHTFDLARELKVMGLINIQYAVRNGILYILEVNPRASRTIPFVSKATGIPLAKIAARVMVGKKLKELGFGREIRVEHISVKESVFPFEKFSDVDSFLGPEMRSTGEVMGIWDDFGVAFAKSQECVGVGLPLKGNVFISVNNHDKVKALKVGKDLAEMGFKIYATTGTAEYFRGQGLESERINKVVEGRPNIVDFIKNKQIHLIINTPLGRDSRSDEYAIGRHAILNRVPLVTTMSGAEASVKGIRALSKGSYGVRSLQEYHERVYELNGIKKAEE